MVYCDVSGAVTFSSDMTSRTGNILLKNKEVTFSKEETFSSQFRIFQLRDCIIQENQINWPGALAFHYIQIQKIIPLRTD